MEIITEQKNNKNTRSFARFKNCYHTWLFTVDYSGIRVFLLLLLLLFIYGMTLMITCPKWDFAQYVPDCLQTMFNQSAIIARKHVHTFATHIYLLSSYLNCSFLIRIPAVILVNLGQWILFAGDFECFLRNFQDNFGWCMFKLKVLDRLIGIIGLIFKFI